MAVFTCNLCESKFVEDMLPRRGSICFKCHVKGVHIGFTQGKEEFHGPTIGERARKTIEDSRAAGLNPEPVGERWV